LFCGFSAKFAFLANFLMFQSAPAILLCKIAKKQAVKIIVYGKENFM